MLNIYKSVSMKKQTYLILECPEGEHIFRKFSFSGKLELSLYILRMYKGKVTLISPLCIVSSVSMYNMLPQKLLLNQAAFCCSMIVCKHHIHLHKGRHSPFRCSYFLYALYCPINKSLKDQIQKDVATFPS